MDTNQHEVTPMPATVDYDDGVKFFRGLAWGLLFAIPAWGIVVGGIALGLRVLGIWR